MSTAKVIFTYKRKRLSSCSGVGHADVCAEFSLDVQAGKHQDVCNEKIKSPEKDLMIYKRVSCNNMDCSKDCGSCLEPYDNQHSDFKLQHVCHGEKMPAACSSFALQNSSRLGEKYDQISDKTNKSKMVLSSHVITGDSTLKTSGRDITAEASLGETTNSIEKDSCLLHSSCMDIEGCMQGGSASQSVEKDSNKLLKECCLGKTEVTKEKSSAPLRTFSRRMKRKADVCCAGMFTKLPLREGDTAIKECDSRPVSSCTCEVALNKSKLAEKSLDMNFEIRDVDERNMLCHSSEKMTCNKIRDSPHPCRKSFAETVIMRQTGETSDPDALGSVSLLKDDVRGSTYDGTVVSSCNVTCKMDEQPVSSQRCQPSSGDSQVTSDSSHLKIGAAKKVEHGAHSNSMDLDLSHPPPGAFVIDCNVVPESDVQEEASDIIQDSIMAKNSEKAVQEKNKKRKSLELFGDNCVQADDSSGVVFTSVKTGSKRKTKSLQLFSEDGKCDQLIPSNTQSESGYSKVQQNAALVLDSQRHQLEQSSCKVSVALGSSLPMGPLYEGQTSKDGPASHLIQNSNVRTCDLIQNPVVKSFPDQASFRHKLLLESINTRATSLRGNRNISLDKLEPCPAIWSEEELDSLWIGMRRHGKGNWHAMILDPRLRFAPWRTAGDLEDQWGREQNKLFSGQHMPSSKYLKPQDAFKLHCHGPVCHRSVAAETQLSLGDIYAHSDGVFSGSAPSYGITQLQRHVTMASSVGPSACGLFNNVQANVMIREVSSNGPTMAFGMNNCLPHWLRNPISTPMPLEPSLPPISALPQVGGLQLVHAFPEIPGAPCLMKNLINTKLAGVHVYPPSCLQHVNPITMKSGLADNLIVIDSDTSSEGTISDDHDNRC